jgi:hypothetical protein
VLRVFMSLKIVIRQLKVCTALVALASPLVTFVVAVWWNMACCNLGQGLQ